MCRHSNTPFSVIILSLLHNASWKGILFLTVPWFSGQKWALHKYVSIFFGGGGIGDWIICNVVGRDSNIAVQGFLPMIILSYPMLVYHELPLLYTGFNLVIVIPQNSQCHIVSLNNM